VLEHLEEREGGDVDLLGGVEERRVRRRLPHPAGAEDPLQPLHGFSLACSIWSWPPGRLEDYCFSSRLLLLLLLLMIASSSQQPLNFFLQLHEAQATMKKSIWADLKS
jgi:hypothetical protein